MSNSNAIHDLFYAERWKDFGIEIEYSRFLKHKEIRVHLTGGYVYVITFKVHNQAIFDYSHGRDAYYHIVRELLRNIPHLTLEELITQFAFSYDHSNLDMFKSCETLEEYHKIYDVIEEFEL